MLKDEASSEKGLEKPDYERLLENLTEAVGLFKFDPNDPPYFSTNYSEDFDEYILFCFTEPEDPSSSTYCFKMDLAIINMENKAKPVTRFEKASFEISKIRFNKDFGLDYRMLMADERKFFMQAYSKLVHVYRHDVEPGSQEEPHSAQIKEFTVELTHYQSHGSTYRSPIHYNLLSNKKQPIAIVVNCYNEYFVRMVGCVISINPSTV